MKAKRPGFRTLVSVLVAVLLVILLAPVGRATGSFCLYDPKTEEMNVILSKFPTDIRIFVAKNGDFMWGAIGSTASTCPQQGGPEHATVQNVNNIDVSDLADINNHLLVDMKRLWAPGTPTEGMGKSEIEAEIDLAGAGQDTLEIRGAGRNDSFVFGEPKSNVVGFNFNGDSDRDMRIQGLEFLNVLGKAGADVIDLRGGLGTGGETPGQLASLTGGLGGDRLFGAALQSGGDGADLLRGDNASNNLLVGGGNADKLRGLDGGDELFGNGGGDDLGGGTGNDSLDGGPGSDVCAGGPGSDTVSNCEG